MHPILTGMSLDKGSIFLIEGSATNTEFPILTLQLWERPLGCVFPQSKLDAWAFEAIANIIVCNFDLFLELSLLTGQRLWHPSRHFGRS